MMVTETDLIEAFVNTLHRHPGAADEDALPTAAAVRQWLADHGVAVVGRVDAADRGHAVELREALRTLLLANNGVDVESAPAWRVVDEAARRARIELRFRGSVPELVSAAPGLDGALGRIVAAVQATIAAGGWSRLKACRAGDCHWAFEDVSKNQSRAWCSMSSCGNREKARTFRRRRVDSA
jgi:predicted RNA-binding Zn ribbon-like protein